ncbi:leucine-rich repeat protein [Pelomyxa schiedti]|nr:leucine-rich repeat protein [Pelomyxa schiedti]
MACPIIMDKLTVTRPSTCSQELGEAIRDIKALSPRRILSIVCVDDQKLTRIPSYIYSIFSIQNLYLQANQITSISGRISNLINLEELYLGGNKLTKIPEEIGTLTKLRELSLSCNNLQSIPSCVGNLTNLRQLYLDNNKLTSLPDSFSQLTQLETFYVNNNELTSISESLSTLVNLHDFYIFGNQITTLPDGIVQLPKLTDLKLQLLAPLAPESSADPKLIPDAPSSSSVPTEIFEASNTTICESPTRVSPEQIQDSTTIQQLQSSKLQCIQGQLAQALKQLDQQRHNHEIALQEMARQHELEISNMHREHQKTLEDQSRSYSEKEEVLTKKLHRIEDDFQQAMEHVLSHVQEEKWVHHPTAQPLSSFSKFTISVNDSPVSIHETSFAENICCFCPLDKVVKMLVHNHCGVSEQCQEVMLSNGKSLSGTVSNLFELEEEEDSARRAPGTFRATHGAVSWLSATVRILPEVKDIYESDLQIVEIIGSGHNGSVAKCHYVPENRQVSVKRSHDHTRKFDRKLFKTQATAPQHCQMHRLL